MKHHVSSAATLIAIVLAGAANASPVDADLWIGLPGTEDGFLLNQETGAVWMTGICLRPIENAEKIDGAWVSRNSEFVSVGRMQALLSQTFTLTVDDGVAGIRVDNPARGGAQDFPATMRDCAVSGACQPFEAQPAC